MSNENVGTDLKSFSLLLFPMLLLFAGESENTLAGDRVTWLSRPFVTNPCQPCCCLDDYVSKPAPCMVPVPSCGTDDYCSKPCLRAPRPFKCTCSDDYCTKPFTWVYCPAWRATNCLPNLNCR